MRQDLQALQENLMPFDVFLIDECWSLGQWGDFEAVDSWPAGMASAAQRIRAAGYTPGVWSCPYLVDFESDLARAHPAWLLKNRNGDRITFPMNDVDHWVLDPTFPGVCDFLETTYRKLSRDWGYDYFKFDFMRAVFLDTGQQFHDQTKTRLEAYRMGLEAIRRGTGPNAYLSVCGGHYGGSLGLANSQRSGSDVVSYWDANQIPKYRQNILRTWMNRLWHVDPDAMMVRNREQPYYPDRNLSLGKFSLEEAETNALNQYIGGGIVTFTEFMPELGSDRKALYRHVIPSLGSTSVPLDIFNQHCPRYMLTYVRPRCETLEPWVTVSIVNWGEEVMKPEVQLSSRVTGHIQADRYLVCEFFSQKVLGIYDKGQSITLEELPPHQSYILHISPWTGETPVLAGTDLHYSGGGVEITEWHAKNETVQGKVETRWDYPVRVTVVFPNRTEPGSIGAVKTIELPKGQQKFTLSHY